MALLTFLAGMALLAAGGAALVRGSVSVARKLGVSDVVIGLTIVGLCTAMPELVTSLRAVQQGAPGLAVGSVVGANIANILLVLGLAALIRPISTHPAQLQRDGIMLLAATAAICLLIYFDAFTRMAGLILLAGLIVFLMVSILLDQKETAPAGQLHRAEGAAAPGHFGWATGLLLIVFSLAAIIYGARLAVDAARMLSVQWGVQESIIGLSLVALATTLPELITAIIASVRGRNELAVASVMGTNIVNAFGTLGLTALYKPFSVRGDLSAEAMSQTASTSLFSLQEVGALILSAFLLMLFAMSGRQLARWEGALMLIGYALYLGFLFDVLHTHGVPAGG